MKLLLVVCLAFIAQSAFCQQEEDRFFVFDKDWKPVDTKHAVYFLRVRKNSDSDYVWLFYNMFGPRLKQESYKDLKATVRDGEYIYYQDNGHVDSAGRYTDGQQNGSWYFRDAKGRFIRRKSYAMGVLVKDSVYNLDKEDSLKREKLLPGEIESEFPGGLPSWGRFLNKNLHYPDRALNSNIMGEVRLNFTVDERGNVLDPGLFRSVEYSLDEEALRIMKLSPAWTPASKDGVPVKSYKVQPIEFRLEVQ